MHGGITRLANRLSLFVTVVTLSVGLAACNNSRVSAPDEGQGSVQAALGGEDRQPSIEIVAPEPFASYDRVSGPVLIVVQVQTVGWDLSSPDRRVFILLDGAPFGEVDSAGALELVDPPAGMHSLGAIAATGDGTLVRSMTDATVITVTDACTYDEDCPNENRCVSRFCFLQGDGQRRCRYGWADPECCVADVDCGPGRACGEDGLCADCVSDMDCDDGDSCTVDRCVGGSCQAAPLGECCGDADCDDGRFCTQDRCVDGACTFIEHEGSGCCEGDDPQSECPEVDACTAAACVDHVCRYGPIGGVDCCVEDDAECDDANDCTIDRCDAEVNLCVHSPDVDQPGCCADATHDCDDDDPSTLATCVDARCFYTDDPTWCNADHPCEDDDNTCTEERCVGNRCRHIPVAMCCRRDLDCLDGDVCTRGSCVDGGCVYEEIASCCRVDAACDDGDPCSMDVCIGGLCKHGPDPEMPGCCSDDDACDDGNFCTADRCLSDHTCESTPLPLPGCCNTNFDCIPGWDGGIGIGDLPSPVLHVCRNHRCVEDPNPASCEANPTCTDDDPCTDDYCETSSGLCRHLASRSCCHTSSECRDGDPCTRDRCQDNACVHVPVDACCESDAGCDDDDPCTEDFCIGSLCRYRQLGEGCCHADADCEDGDSCTLDRCDREAHTCRHEPGGEGDCCFSDAGCDDGVDSTRDFCEDHACQHIPIYGFCSSHDDCDDDNPCTTDWCLHNVCRFVPPGGSDGRFMPETCCVTADDCLNDDDPCTIAHCIVGRCELEDVPDCVREIGFLEEFAGNTLPAGWVSTIDPPEAGPGFGPPPGGGVDSEGIARFLPSPDPELRFEGQLLTPWLDASHASVVTLQFDQRRAGPGVLADSAIEVRALANPGSAWTTVWRSSLDEVSGTDWQLTTVDISLIAHSDQARVALVYRGLSTAATATWQIDWLAIDRGVPPTLRTDPPDISVAVRSVGEAVVVATDPDPWSEDVWFAKEGLPGFVTFAGYHGLGAEALAALLGESLPEGWDFGQGISVGPPTPWGWGFAATLRAAPTIDLTDIGSYVGKIEARGDYLRDRQLASVLVMPHHSCGDGSLDLGEDCDDGEFNSDTRPNACRTSCLSAHCGDGVVDEGEDCDGDATSSHGCRADCTIPSYCGDGVVDPGEDCDDGVNNNDHKPDACRTSCKLPRCGDGVRDTGEECDWGPSISTGTFDDPAQRVCRGWCVFSFCGDGIRDAGEDCDDGDANDDGEPDACRTNCHVAWCGDGVVDKAEACDDGPNTGDPTQSLCVAGCQALGELELWPPAGELNIAFEDLPFGRGNDYDFNDWVSTFVAHELVGPRGYAWGLSFENWPKWRGAGYDHQQHIRIAGDRLQSGGTLEVRWYDKKGELMKEDPVRRFEAGEDLDFISIPSSKAAMARSSKLGRMVASIRFDEGFVFGIGSMRPEEVGIHGERLFFDPYIRVKNTGQEIHLEDTRLLAVPQSWAPPRERVKIWVPYPRVHEGDPPVFEPMWYRTYQP